MGSSSEDDDGVIVRRPVGKNHPRKGNLIDSDSEAESILENTLRVYTAADMTVQSANMSVGMKDEDIPGPLDVADQIVAHETDEFNEIAKRVRKSLQSLALNESGTKSQLPNPSPNQNNMKPPEIASTSREFFAHFANDNSGPSALNVSKPSQANYDKTREEIRLLKFDLEKVRHALESLGETLPEEVMRMQLQSVFGTIARAVYNQELATLVVEGDVSSLEPSIPAAESIPCTSLKNGHTGKETCPTEDVLEPTPSKLKKLLMPHQQHSLAWMLWRENQEEPCGGILGDDMGLGKSLSIIALVLAGDKIVNNKENTESSEDDSDDHVEEVQKYGKETNNKEGRQPHYFVGGTLIVCTPLLIEQWKREVEDSVKEEYCSVYIHHGRKRTTKPEQLATHLMVITTYGVVTSERKKNGPLFDIRWNRIVLDEAHMIRDHRSVMAKDSWALKGKRRWCVSGTPIQNDIMDVFSLFKFLKVQGYESPKDFKTKMKINRGAGSNRLNERLRPMLLRRTKDELQGKGLVRFPVKYTEHIVFPLDTDEMNVYTKILRLTQSVFARFMTQRNMQPDVMPQENGVVEEIDDSKLYNLLIRLRQICIHPGLIDSILANEDLAGSDVNGEQPKELDLLTKITDSSHNENSDVNNNSNSESQNHLVPKAPPKVLIRSNPVFNLDRPSSKCRKVLEIIQKIEANSDDKIVLYSQWNSVLNILAKFLRDKGMHFVELTGNTRIDSRNDIVNQFNEPKTPQRILLLSLVAGGVGLNLIGANHLILMDPHWNPQVERQAIDRIHRMGQTKPVHIYRLLCENTVEIGIKIIQDRKLNTAEGVLTGTTNTTTNKLSSLEYLELFQTQRNGSGDAGVPLRNAPIVPTPSPFKQIPLANAFVGNMGMGNGRVEKRSNRKLTKADSSVLKLREPPPVPSRNNVMRRISQPPPPKPNVARPPARVPTTKPRANPPSDHILQNQTAGTVQAPPPPPPMPPAFVTSTQSDKSKSSPKPVVNDTRNALMESIRKGTTLKKVDPTTLSTGSGTNSLTLALQRRIKAMRVSDVEEDSSDNDEWDN